MVASVVLPLTSSSSITPAKNHIPALPNHYSLSAFPSPLRLDRVAVFAHRVRAPRGRCSRRRRSFVCWGSDGRRTRCRDILRAIINARVMFSSRSTSIPPVLRCIMFGPNIGACISSLIAGEEQAIRVIRFRCLVTEEKPFHCSRWDGKRRGRR